MLPDAYFITTPIYYVNGLPHIGSAYTSLAADVLARFYRLKGCQVKFLTGTDEHGQKVAQSAQKESVETQDYVDRLSQKFRDLSSTLNFTEDDFIRTTEPRHIKGAQALWQKLVDNGHIYKSTYAGWYSVRDEAFYGEEELKDGKAPTGGEVEWVEEPSYFFDLSKWQAPLLKFYADHPDFIGPKSRRNEVLRFVEGGLKDLSVSRSTLKWGVPVPGDESHVMYVWVEALSNYINALGYPDVASEDFRTFWPESVHLVGKDILRFHAVYWPALCLAADIPPPKRVFAHGWWTMEGQKISKSLGNTIDPGYLTERFGTDQVRYFLAREVPFGSDGDFSLSAFMQRVNSDLANDYGNLAQRVLSFIQKHADGRVPTPAALTDADTALKTSVTDLLGELDTLAKHQALSKMCEAIWAVISKANRYIDVQEPWQLRKTDPARMHTVLYVLADVIRQITILASPFIPEGAETVLDQLSIPETDRTFDALSKPLKIGELLPAPAPAFPRIAKEEAEAKKA